MIKAAGDDVWMQEALKLAQKAALLGEVPVGAVLTYSRMNAKPDSKVPAFIPEAGILPSAFPSSESQRSFMNTGTLLSPPNKIISSAYNQPITLCDPTAHAEILAIRQAGQYFQNYRLLNTTLYVTLEPCPMCLGAIEHARIPRVVFGAFDTRRAQSSLNQKIPNLDLFGGVLESECKEVLQTFFKARRHKNHS